MTSMDQKKIKKLKLFNRKVVIRIRNKEEEKEMIIILMMIMKTKRNKMKLMDLRELIEQNIVSKLNH
jgi:hypothetical protein